MAATKNACGKQKNQDTRRGSGGEISRSSLNNWLIAEPLDFARKSKEQTKLGFLVRNLSRITNLRLTPFLSPANDVQQYLLRRWSGGTSTNIASLAPDVSWSIHQLSC
ncbi:hypothetical protein ACO22_00834 [Paracoccidioides brasiliensis]|uniref:Uncharacterized protein n=1 Tax=Paracoccidioides brasiliensis TaxID=121759 RepID=A0A1D2JN85_PARBR|nr:hypothetical protein ACO22_00834 [Paracoccidioides brasiliensis]